MAFLAGKEQIGLRGLAFSEEALWCLSSNTRGPGLSLLFTKSGLGPNGVAPPATGSHFSFPNAQGGMYVTSGLFKGLASGSMKEGVFPLPPPPPFAAAESTRGADG